MHDFRLMGAIGAAILIAASALMMWRSRRRHEKQIAPSAADIHVPPPPFAAYGH